MVSAERNFFSKFLGVHNRRCARYTHVLFINWIEVKYMLAEVPVIEVSLKGLLWQ